MTYEETAKDLVETMFCKGCEIDCLEDDKCVWLVIREALDKQIPKKPYKIEVVASGQKKALHYCSECDALVFAPDCYCIKCGQAIDWSNPDDI